MNVPMLLTPKINVTYLMAGGNVMDGLEKILESGYNSVPVLCEDGRYYGTVSCRDFLEYCCQGDGDAVYVSELINSVYNPPVSIDADISELLERLMESNFVPVVDDRDCFVGIVTRKSILDYMLKSSVVDDWNCCQVQID